MQPYTSHYTSAAKVLHWTIAGFILAQIPLGIYMTRVEGDLTLRFNLYQLHKSIGVTVLGLMLLRIFWRVLHTPPSLPGSMPVWEQRAAHLSHIAFYLLLVALPLSGWAVVSIETRFPFPTVLYGRIPWPHIPFIEALPVEQKKALEPVLKTVHASLGWMLLALIGLHVAAALRHGLILKDGVMSRMLPRFKSASGAAVLIGAAAILPAMLPNTQSAAAAEWDLKAQQSRIGFEATGGGQTVKGSFEKFAAEIRFDPEALQSADIAVSIDTASAKSGMREVDSALPTADWFNIKQYPKAAFKAKSARRTGENRYELAGELTIKGVTKPLTLPFSLTLEGGEATVRGEVVINRLDYNIGPPALGPIALPADIKLSIELQALRLDN